MSLWLKLQHLKKYLYTVIPYTRSRINILPFSCLLIRTSYICRNLQTSEFVKFVTCITKFVWAKFVTYCCELFYQRTCYVQLETSSPVKLVWLCFQELCDKPIIYFITSKILLQIIVNFLIRNFDECYIYCK